MFILISYKPVYFFFIQYVVKHELKLTEDKKTNCKFTYSKLSLKAFKLFFCKT